MIDCGQVALYADGDCPPRGIPAVRHDLPFPRIDGVEVEGVIARPVQVAEAWRSVTKTFLDINAPPWLEEKAFCPAWWPKECCHGRRITTKAFFDGLIPPEWDDLAGGSDHAIRIETYQGIQLFGYITDLYDTDNVSVWVDMNYVASPRNRYAGAYMIGSDGNSAYIDNGMSALLEEIQPVFWHVLSVHPRIRYPKLVMCRRVGQALYSAGAKPYEQLGKMTRMNPMTAIRTMAFQLLLITEQCSMPD